MLHWPMSLPPLDEGQQNSALRRQAEQRLQNQFPDDPAFVSPQAVQRQLHELQVHQIELELQNEALREARLQVEEAAERYADFYDFAPVGYVTLDRSGNICQCNLALASLLGRNRARLVGARFGFSVAMAEREMFANFLRQVFDQGSEHSCDLTLIRSDDAKPGIRVVVNAVRSNDALQCRAVLTDISERKKLESGLQASHDLLEKLSQNVPGVVYQYRRWPDGRRCFPYASAGMADIYEVTPEQVREDASPATARLHPDDRDVVQAALIESARTLQTWTQEFRVNLPRQGLRWLSGLARPERLADGSTLWHGFITDITERMRAEADMQQVMQAAGDVVWISDLTERHIFANRAACSLLGYTIDEYLTMRIADLLAEPELAGLPAHMERLKTEPFVRREWSLKGKNGSTIVTELVTQRLGEDRYLAIGHDVSERKRLEAQKDALQATLRSALVREVHHRIKNNLQGVAGILSEFGRTHPQTQEAIEQLVAQVQSVAVIHGLQGQTERNQVKLCELTSAVARGVGTLWKRQIDVAVPTPWSERVIGPADAVPVALVLNELLQNAVKHSHPATGVVQIAIQKVDDTCAVLWSIVNAGDWPGKGSTPTKPLGNGLQLVHTLLPREGAQLTHHTEGGYVHTVLVLGPPVLSFMDDFGFKPFHLLS